MIPFLVIFLIIPSVLCVSPEQVVISASGNPTEMDVTWITLQPYENSDTVSFVQYGTDPNNLNRLNKTSTVTKWIDNGFLKFTRYTHRVKMTNLEPGTKYYYSVGSAEGISRVFNFKSLNKDAKSVKIAIYGDFGLDFDESVKELTEQVQQGAFDMIIHIGDIAYNLNSGDGVKGDLFMMTMQNITAYVPYMVLAGNHESDQNFLHFKNRFTTPKAGDFVNENQFWSLDIGPVHFTGLSSEYYAFQMYPEANRMYNWMVEDLKATSKPWIISGMHRPMYCSLDCDGDDNKALRNGGTNLSAIEPIIGKYGVDMMFVGHQHYYERMYPTYKSTTFKSSDSQRMHNAKATVHTLSGSAGCHSHAIAALIRPLNFSAFLSDKFGYSVIEVTNSTTLNMWFMDMNGKQLDYFTLTKDEGYRPIAKF